MRKLVLILCLLLGLYANSCSPGLALLIRPTRSSQVIPVQAHRGGGLALPENTLETLLTMWEQGIVPEVDLRTTKDGVIILLHDRTVRRVAPEAPPSIRKTPVELLPYAQLQHLDVGASRGYPGRHIPRLDTVLAILHEHPHYRLFLDCKQVNTSQLLALIKKYRVRRQVILATSNYNTIQRIKLHNRRITTLLWGIDREHLPLVRQVSYRGINYVQVRYLIRADGSPNFNDEELIQLNQELARHNIVLQVLLWHSADPELHSKMFALGISSIASDYPETAYQAFADFMASESGR